jgi:hypothetical protein
MFEVAVDLTAEFLDDRNLSISNYQFVATSFRRDESRQIARA